MSRFYLGLTAGLMALAVLANPGSSAVAEDKAEIWATLMCYQHVLVDQGGASQVLMAKAALLQARARQICDELDEQWWARVREAQLKQQDHWEAHSSDEPGKRQYWFNWVTGERRNSKPEGHQMNGSRHERHVLGLFLTPTAHSSPSSDTRRARARLLSFACPAPPALTTAAPTRTVAVAPTMPGVPPAGVHLPPPRSPRGRRGPHPPLMTGDRARARTPPAVHCRAPCGATCASPSRLAVDGRHVNL